MPLGKNQSLRELLLDAIERVKDGTLEPDRAAAVAELSQAVINADRFELDAIAFVAENGGKPRALESRQPLALTHDDNEEVEPEDDEEIEDEEDEEEPDEPAPTKTKPSTKPPADKSRYQNMVLTLLKTDQPLQLEEIARITKIPQGELFKVLADEKSFERDGDRRYWVR